MLALPADRTNITCHTVHYTAGNNLQAVREIARGKIYERQLHQTQSVRHLIKNISIANEGEKRVT
jgi:hypothetical protein